jgi:Holliday junction resolvase
MSGDVICPENFRYSIECKSYNVNIDFFSKSALVDEWRKQAVEDANKVGKVPMICWKRPRKGWVVMIPLAVQFINSNESYRHICKHYCYYNGWAVMRIEELFRIEDKFFFKTEMKFG